jgi:hypothetical protein
MTHDINLFTLRVLIEKDSTYGYFVAHCLETGNVVTADDSKTVTQMMLEVLYDEVAYALKNKDYTNLFSSPAPSPIWEKWSDAAEKVIPREERLEVQANDARKTAQIVVGEAA